MTELYAMRRIGRLGLQGLYALPLPESITPVRDKLAPAMRAADDVVGGLRSRLVRTALLTYMRGVPRVRLELALPKPKTWKAPR